MNRTRTTSLILISVLIVTGLGAGRLLAGDDHGEAYRLRREAQIMPFEQIMQRIDLQPGDRILEIENEFKHKRHIYEIEYLTEEGVVMEIKVDAETGEILKREREKDASASGRRRRGAD